MLGVLSGVDSRGKTRNTRRRKIERTIALNRKLRKQKHTGASIMKLTGNYRTDRLILHVINAHFKNISIKQAIELNV